MTMQCVQVDRWSIWLGWRWPAVLVVVWLGVGLAAMGLSHHLDRPVELCLFKNVTGLACPTCGFTRGMFALLRGHPIDAWLYNPLLFSFLAALGVTVFVRLVFARSLEVRLTRWERTFCWVVASAVFAANWCYVIRCVG